MSIPAPSANQETKLGEKSLKALIDDFAATFVSLWQHGRAAPKDTQEAATAHAAPPNGARQPQSQDTP